MKENECGQLSWQWRTFAQLSTSELYSLLQLRQQVFVVEQNCPYLDVDGLDSEALHLLCLQHHGDGGQLVGCLRVLPPGKRFNTPSIGRIATAASIRGQGTGRFLLNEALHHTRLIHPGQEITISAQQYLERFYESFGFTALSKPYLEDDIPHIDMILRPPKV